MSTDTFEKDFVELMCNLKGKRKYKSLDERFNVMAKDLMNSLSIVAGNEYYRIVECEIYYYDKENHPDIYTHKSPKQLEACNWYFHGSGIDITFGNKSQNIYGGILIRGIRGDNRYISGPLNVKDELLNKMGNILSEKNNIFVTRLLADDIPKFVPIQSTRIGLKKKSEDKLNFIQKPYRYIYPVKEHKFKNKSAVITKLLKDKEITKEQAKEFIGYNIKQ